MSATPGKVLITLDGEEISPRFDLTTEALVATLAGDGTVRESRTVVLPKPCAEDLCDLIVSESVTTVVCGGIEEEFHQYLTWKKVRVIDSVMGTGEQALAGCRRGDLAPETNLFAARRPGGRDA